MGEVGFIRAPSEVATALSAFPLTVAEIGELYRHWSRQLLRVVRGTVRAPGPVVEDACQVAWSRLLHSRGSVRRDTVLSWLTTTALHEAMRLAQLTSRELSLETVLERGMQLPAAPSERTSEACAEAREQLRRLDFLPLRQQTLLWLHGLGFSYEEIAHRQGCSSRTVERQLHHARASLRSA